MIIFLGKENGTPKILIPLTLLERKIFHFKLRFVEFIGQQWGASTFTILKNQIVCLILIILRMY